MTGVAQGLRWMLVFVLVPDFQTGLAYPCGPNECLGYIIRRRLGKYQLRDYGPSNWATHLVPYTNNSNPLETLRYTLMAYVTGGNEDGTRITWGRPILRITSQSNHPGIHTMAFYLPSATNPRPNCDISLEHFQKLSLHVRPATGNLDNDFKLLKEDAAPGHYKENEFVILDYGEFGEEVGLVYK